MQNSSETPEPKSESKSFLVVVPFYVGISSIQLTSLVPIVANVFHIWSTLAGYEELARSFELVRRGEIVFFFDMNKNFELKLRTVQQFTLRTEDNNC